MVLFLAGRAQSADSAAVERAERSENFEPAALAMAPSAGELYRRLDGLRTRVAEEEPAVAKQLGQARRQPRVGFGMKDVRDVRQFLGLLLDGPDDARMGMPEAGHRQPAEEIEVTVAFGVVEIRAISPHKSEWKASIGIGQALVRESDDFRVFHRADLLFDFPASRPRQNSENENVSACVYHGLRRHVSAAMLIIVRSRLRSPLSDATRRRTVFPLGAIARQNKRRNRGLRAH